MSNPEWLKTLAQPGAIVSESILDDIRNHLEFLGFEATQCEGYILFRQQLRYVWTARDLGGGVLLRAFFTCSDVAKADPSLVVNVANQINCEAVLLRAYCDSDTRLCFECWHPNVYDKASFGAFFARLEKELDIQMAARREALDPLLP